MHVATQQQIKNISNQLNNHKKEVQILRSEKDTLESVLTMKTADVKKSLSNELVRIEEEMYQLHNLGKDTSISKRLKTAASSSRSPPSRGRRPPCSSSSWACSAESPNSRCRWAARANDCLILTHFETFCSKENSHCFTAEALQKYFLFHTFTL